MSCCWRSPASFGGWTAPARSSVSTTSAGSCSVSQRWIRSVGSNGWRRFSVLRAVSRRGASVRPTVFLDQVLQSGRGHPALLAVVYLEAARRAGVDLVLYSWGPGWYVGAPGARELVFVAREEPLDSDERSGPSVLQAHCSHELAYGILDGLAEVFLRLGRVAPAERALQLRNLLPVHP